MKRRTHHSFGIHLPSFFILFGATHAANYTYCKAHIIELLTQNGSIPLDTNATLLWGGRPDPIYHGHIFGFNVNAEPRPLTLTLQGCKDYCGADPDFNDVIAAFATLTTWVLPVIALLSELPYESVSDRKIKNVEAFLNWIGSPAASLTTTTWNIQMIKKCETLAQQTEDKSLERLTRDSLYILSCVNQYQYHRRNDVEADRQRDRALLRGVLYPFLAPREISSALRTKLEGLTLHMAFQLRLQRRKGVYPLTLSIAWFLLAFIISIVSAFAELGDGTTAHSLAIGLLLSWLPILVVAAIIDRNPLSSSRCAILIQRWLYNVDVLFQNESQMGANEMRGRQSRLMYLNHQRRSSQATSTLYSRYSDGSFPDQYLRVDGSKDLGDARESLSPSPDSRPREEYEMNDTSRLLNRSPTNAVGQQWRHDSDTSAFSIGEFVGQGRRLRYCAVTDTVLTDTVSKAIKNPVRFGLKLPGDEEAIDFRKRLPTRPGSWYVTWAFSQFFVVVGYIMGFLVSFETPTVGLGCRSGSYTVWQLLSMVSWVLLGIFQEPPKYVRYLAWVTNGMAAFFLFAIMTVQVLGVDKSCICQSTVFGSKNLGGYMDFENGEFYKAAYNVKTVWGTATAFGLLNSVGTIVWYYRRWSHDSKIWKINEEAVLEIVDGVDLNWLT